MASRVNRMIKFVSWNTNGIKNTNKSRSKFPTMLKIFSNLQADIVFLQETHIGPKCRKILEKVPGWNVYFTVYSSQSKGVAILIKNSVPFEYICHDEDCDGCYIVLFCHLFGELHTLVNVYHHKKDEYFLVRLKDYLMEKAGGVLVVGGDFNTVLHPSFDRKSSRRYVGHSPFRKAFEYFTVALNLRDAWSHVRPTHEGFTRRQNDSFSRIDMFLLSEHRMGRVYNITVLYHGAEVLGVSDHFPLILELSVHPNTEENLLNASSECNAPGKISGSVILRVINSLMESDKLLLIRMNVYCKDHHELSKSLKNEYHSLTENKVKVYDRSEKSHISKIESLMTQLLTRRLRAFISFKGTEKIKQDNKNKTSFDVKYQKCQQKIKWSFLEHILKQVHSELPKHVHQTEIRLLKFLLPKDPDSSALLERESSLTNVILGLALKELEKMISINFCEGTVCYHRQILRIHTQGITSDFTDFFVIFFEVISGLKIHFL